MTMTKKRIEKIQKQFGNMIEFDKEKNCKLRGKEEIISKPGSRVTVMIVPTNEELMIAQDTYEIVSKMKGQ